MSVLSVPINSIDLGIMSLDDRDRNRAFLSIISVVPLTWLETHPIIPDDDLLPMSRRNYMIVLPVPLDLRARRSPST